jgi:hypothetical protein
VGVAGVCVKLRAWLVAKRRVHEKRRLTLIRMLGAGITLPDPSENDEHNVKILPRDQGPGYRPRKVPPGPHDGKKVRYVHCPHTTAFAW